MENASKALIIAGSILLAMAIIGLGMYVFTQASSLADTKQLTKVEIATYNSEFEAYEGEQRSYNVRTLLDKVIQHNIANQDDISRQIAVSWTSSADEGKTKEVDDISSSASCNTTQIQTWKNSVEGIRKVYFRYSKKTGLIIEIVIYTG